MTFLIRSDIFKSLLKVRQVEELKPSPTLNSTAYVDHVVNWGKAKKSGDYYYYIIQLFAI